MRLLLAFIFMLLFITSFSFAQDRMHHRKGHMEMMAKTMGRDTHPMIYVKILNKIITKASALELTDKQEKELVTIRDNFVYPLIRKKADFEISHMKIMYMLQNPNFDPKNVKAETKASSEINLNMSNMFIDGLVAIRKTIGVENFEKVTGDLYMKHHKIMEKKPGEKKKTKE